MDPNNTYNPQGTDPNAYGQQPYQQPGMDPNAYNQQAYQQPYQQSYQQPGMDPNAYGQQPYNPAPAYGGAPAAPAAPTGGNGKKIGLIIAICVVAAALITVAVLLITGVIGGGGGGKDGTYETTEEMFGEKITVTITVKGSKGTFAMKYEGQYSTGDDNYSQDFDASWDGDVLSMDVDGEVLKATYSKKDKTLTIAGEDFLGTDLVLKKK